MADKSSSRRATCAIIASSLAGLIVGVVSGCIFFPCGDGPFETHEIESGIYVTETSHLRLFATPPTDVSEIYDAVSTTTAYRPVTSVLDVEQEAGTVTLRHTEPDGRVVERFFQIVEVVEY